MKRRDFNKIFITTAIASLSFTKLTKLAIAGARVDSPYLFVKPFRPTKLEVRSTEIKTLFGKIPFDLSGSYYRNGPNQHFVPEGAYHWFDGDGMIHCTKISNGMAFYSNKQVKTKKLDKEKAQNKSLYSGFSAAPARQNLIDHSQGLPIYPDTSNTDLIYLGEKLYSTRAPLGEMYEIDKKTLRTKGTDNLNGELDHFIAAHSKVDKLTGEFTYFGFDLAPSKMGKTFIHTGAITSEGDRLFKKSFEINGPKNIHDFAISENYSILLDQPLLITQSGLKFDNTRSSRFGFVNRKEQDPSITWIESSADYIIHTGNAFEEGDRVTLYACEVTNLNTPSDFGEFRLETRFSSWVFNLKTQVLEKKTQILQEGVDFPIINEKYLTKNNQYTFLTRIDETSKMYEIDALIKYDHRANKKLEYQFPEDIKGNEFSFVEKVNSSSEDEGYLIGFVQDSRTEKSFLYIIDALTMKLECGLCIPNVVPAGFHGVWVED